VALPCQMDSQYTCMDKSNIKSNMSQTSVKHCMLCPCPARWTASTPAPHTSQPHSSSKCDSCQCMLPYCANCSPVSTQAHPRVRFVDMVKTAKELRELMIIQAVQAISCGAAYCRAADNSAAACCLGQCSLLHTASPVPPAVG
jgi:hypothetical protein